MTTPKKTLSRTAQEQANLNNRLIDEAQLGNIVMVQTLLAAGVDVSLGDSKALRMAAYHGHAEVVQALFAAGADVCARDDAALCGATQMGSTDTVRTLLAIGANVHARNDYALRCAACYGHENIVEALTKHIFSLESWCGKSRVEIEAYAETLYDKIKTGQDPQNFIEPKRLDKAASILLDSALTCWEQIRPLPPKLQISPFPTQPRPL